MLVDFYGQILRNNNENVYKSKKQHSYKSMDFLDKYLCNSIKEKINNKNINKKNNNITSV